MRVGVPNGLSNLRSSIKGVKTYWFENFFISLERYSNLGHLKHKLWPKERPGVKLAI
jgi:hypothetical protein